jgi:hypothetical protein
MIMIILDDQLPQNCRAGITRRLFLSTAQSTNLPGNHRENSFAHLIRGEHRLDSISFFKDILIVSPEWDEPSREQAFLFLFFSFFPVRK